MAINWEEIQYRGDAADIGEMFSTYRVEDYLEAFEENRRQADQGIRDRLMKEGIKLTERLSPRIYKIFADTCARLQIETNVEVFCLPSPEINAFATLDFRGVAGTSLLGITAAALEKLEDDELSSIIGHELGHFLFKHNRLLALISTDRSNPSVTVLPPLGESLFLRWRKKSEISADRVALLACHDFRNCSRALLKATFGLSERNLNLDVEALLAQLEEIKGRPELMEETFASHPLLPVRLKALQLFAQSDKARRAGLPDGHGLGDNELEAAIDELLLLTRRFPYKPVYHAIARSVALAGALLLAADREISNDEVKILVQILHSWFTDEPECLIETDSANIQEQLPGVLKLVREEGDESDRVFVLSRLADVALADGALMEPEGAVILNVAEQLGVSGKDAYRIMVGAAQSMGFGVDAKLNRIAETLRQSFSKGFTSGSPAL